MKISKKLLWLNLILLWLVIPSKAQEKYGGGGELPKYRMDLIYIFEGSEPEFIFVIGKTGFKSVDSMEKFLETLPAGSTIEWAPGCKRIGQEPLLSSDQEMEKFRKFCADRKINFILVPSG